MQLLWEKLEVPKPRNKKHAPRDKTGKLVGDPRKKSKCLVPGCRRLSLVRGLCGKHYVSWKYWADPKIVAARNRKWRKSATRPRAKCHPSRAHQAKGMCMSCYLRWQWQNQITNNQKKQRSESKRKWIKNNLDRARKGWRRHALLKYGLTLEKLNEMIASQRGACAICKSDKKPLQIDHCHTTGKVRKLLCCTCNGSLAWLEKMLSKNEWVIKAKEYLEQHKTSQNKIAA